MKKNQLKKLKAILLGSSVTISSLYNNINTYAEENGILLTEIYDLMNNTNTSVEKCLITKEHYVGLKLTITEEDDLSWLSSMSNLETLKIYNMGKNTDLSFLNSLPSLKQFTLYEREYGEKTNFDYIANCSNLTYLEVNTPKPFDLKLLENLTKLNDLFLINGTYPNLELLRQYTNIKSLRISVNESTPNNIIESLTHLKKLKLYISNTDHLDYQKLTFLDELSFGNSKPYSIAVNFTTENYNILQSHNVKIVSDKEGYIDQVIEINKKLDEIIHNLEIPNTEHEKLNVILRYVLRKLTYDPTISKLTAQNQDCRVESTKFYQEGLLYGALEKETSICGNYAVLLVALANRMGVEALYLKNVYHSWALVKIDGEYYYVDPTFVDTVYNNAENLIGTKELDWDLEDVKSNLDKLHIPNNISIGDYYFKVYVLRRMI